MSRRLEPESLEPLLAELVAAGGAAGAGHPAPETLLAYHEGRLPADGEAALQDHLAGCPACAAAVLDLDGFAAAAAPRDEEAAGRAPADLATVTAWRAFAPRLAGEATGDARPGSAERPVRRNAGRGRPWWLRAAAAALVAAVPVLGLLLAVSQRQVAELRRAAATPQVAVPILYLDSTTRDEGLDAAVLELPAGDGFFLLAVTPAAAAPAGRYRVEILDQEGRVTWRRDGVAPSDHGALRLGFTRRSMPPGRYRVEVTPGEAAGAPVETTAFDFVLRDPA